MYRMLAFWGSSSLAWSAGHLPPSQMMCPYAKATAQDWTFQSTPYKQNKPVYIGLLASCGGQLEQHRCTWSIKRHGISQYNSCRFFAELSDAIPLGSPELLELHMPQQESAMEGGEGTGGRGGEGGRFLQVAACMQQVRC